SVRGVPGIITESLVHEMVCTPGVNGPWSRGSRHVPAVHVMTSAQEFSSVHAVRSRRRESRHDEGRARLHDGDPSPEMGAAPQATLAVPHAVPRRSSLAVFWHSGRTVPAVSWARRTSRAQRWWLRAPVGAAPRRAAPDA